MLYKGHNNYILYLKGTVKKIYNAIKIYCEL